MAGFSPASGYNTKVVYNAIGEIVSRAGPTGATTTTGWDAAERPVILVNPAGLQTTTEYDNNSNVTDTYGPAPTACFSATAPYLPLANLSGCGVDVVPHTHYGYDEGVTGPETGLWSNLTLSGPPCQETTGLGGDTSLSHVWGSAAPSCADSSGAWSLQMTGLIDLPTAGTWTFQLASQSNLTVSVDGTQLGQATGNGSWGSNGTPTLNVITPGWHQIQVSYIPIQNPTGGQSNGFSVSYQPPGGTMATVPYSGIDPDYGLKTSTVDPDGKVTIATYSNPAGGIDPIDGLATQSIQDPSSTTVSVDGFPASLGDGNGLSLDTQTSYEAPGPGAYFRKLSSTLPAGNATTYSYYSGTAGPQAAVCGVSSTTPQGGLLEQQTDPAVNGISRVQQFVYDAADRQVGVRVGSTTTIATAGWQCTTYDTGGRMTSQSWPANGNAPGRTATYTHSVGGNPLVTAVTDQSGVTCATPTTLGCVTSTVDLLGRVVSYTDALGKSTATSYAQDGQVQSTSGPQGSITTGYDPNSGQATTTALNGTTLSTATYDSASRLSKVAYGNGTSASLGYDNYGNQTGLNYAATSSQVLIDGQDTIKSPAGRITSTNTVNGSNYTTVTPTRIADTRTNSGMPYAGQHLGAGTTLNVQVTGANGDGVPATATAAVLNITAVNATSGTYLTLFPAGTPQPGVSELNVAANTTTNNQVTASVGSGGKVAIYNAAGSIDVLVDVLGYYTPVPTGAAGYTPISPARLADTRAGSGHQDQGQTLASGGSDVVQVTGNAGIPTTGVSAAVVALTAVNETDPGYLTLHPHGTAVPGTSNLNYTTNVPLTKEVTVPLSSSGQFDIYNSGASTDAIVDVMGYYSSGGEAQYAPVTPTRVADTRAGSGMPYAGQHLTTGATLNVQVTAANGDGVPSNATAAVINLTAIDSTAEGYLTVFAAGATQPSTSNLNVLANTLVNSEATVPIGANGQLAIYNASGTVDVLVDVEGYYVPATATSTSYTYDGAGRLTQSAMPGTTYAYGYGTTTGCAANNAGANTNRTSVVVTGVGAGTTDSCYNSADQLTSTTINGGNSNANYSYDPEGNATNDGGTTVTWDSANRQAATTSSTGAVTSYNYDPLNRVIRQQDGTTTTEYSYPGMTTSSEAILDANGNLLDSVVPLIGGVTVTVPVAGLASSTWSYSNLQGDTTLTATDTGTPQGAPLAFDPWGVPLPGSGPVGNTPPGSPSLAAFGAQGKLTDPNSHLISMGARPYNPVEGRFLAVDPIYGGCANAYTYVFGDPLNANDLSGSAGCTSKDSLSASCSSSFLELSVGCDITIGPAMAQTLSSDLTRLPGVAGTTLVFGLICGAIGTAFGTPVTGVIAGAICGVIGAVAGAQIPDSLANAATNDDFIHIDVSIGVFQGGTSLNVYTSSAVPCSGT